MNLMKYLFALLGACAALPAAAQTHRTVEPLELRPEVQAELAFKNGDYLLLSLFGQNNTANNDLTLAAPNRFLGLDERGAGLAYEHFWNDHWSGGAGLRYATPGPDYTLRPELLLRHRSPIGPLTFGQRLSYDRSFASSSATPSQTFLRLRLDLEKVIALGSGSLALRPRLSYEAATHLRQRRVGDADERTIDFTSFRAEVGVRLSARFDLTPWVVYGTHYIISLPQFDANYNQIAGGKTNLVTPVLGLDARLTLFQGKAAFERRQLPTQH